MPLPLEQRIDHIESELAIRNLAASYAVFIDQRDIDNLVQLYVPDVPVGRRSGREALRDSFRRMLGPESPFTTTVHFLGGHLVVLNDDDPDRATGVAYCRAEHEFPETWVVATLEYWDSYERHDGAWLFSERQMKAFYVVDVLERPNGDQRSKRQLGTAGIMSQAEIPEGTQTWQDFWASFEPTGQGISS